MHHKHPRDISLDPRSLELVLLPLRQQVIDKVLQLVMIYAVVDGDCLPRSVSYCILVSGSKSWTLVPADHTRPVEDLHDRLVLFSSRARNSLDSKLLVGMSMRFTKSRSLPVGIRASFPVVLISLVLQYIFSFLELLTGV
jgi:hypothetical protein